MSKFLMILTRDLRVENFETDDFDVTSKEQRQLYGFEPETFKLEVALSDANSADVDKSGTRYSQERGPFPCRWDKIRSENLRNFLSDIDKSAYVFRDRSISRFERDAVNSIKLKYSSGKSSQLSRRRRLVLRRTEPKKQNHGESTLW